MKIAVVAAALTFALCSVAHASGESGYVPAHTTRDGTRVPANVSTISGRAQPVQLVAKARVAALSSGAFVSNAYQTPLFQNARPLR